MAIYLYIRNIYKSEQQRHVLYSHCYREEIANFVWPTKEFLGLKEPVPSGVLQSHSSPLHNG